MAPFYSDAVRCSGVGTVVTVSVDLLTGTLGNQLSLGKLVTNVLFIVKNNKLL